MAKVKDAKTLVELEEEKSTRLRKIVETERAELDRLNADAETLRQRQTACFREASPASLQEAMNLTPKIEEAEHKAASKSRTVAVIAAELGTTAVRIEELKLEQRKEELPLLSQKILAEVQEISGPLRDGLLDAQARLAGLGEKNRQLQDGWRETFGEGSSFVRRNP